MQYARHIDTISRTLRGKTFLQETIPRAEALELRKSRHFRMYILPDKITWTPVPEVK